MSGTSLTTDLAILVPVLGRPHRVQPLLTSIEAATPEAHVVFVCDPDDEPEHDAITAARRLRELNVRMLCEGGNYAHKINVGIQATTEPLIFTGADDLHFHPGWFELAAGRISDEIGVVGTNDLCNRRVIAGEHSTHSLVSRVYVEAYGTIDECGKLLHEGYEHEYVDDELVETAKSRAAYAHVGDAIVEHLHPDVGKAPSDRLYAAQAERMRRTRRIFDRRRLLWTSQ